MTKSIRSKSLEDSKILSRALKYSLANKERPTLRLRWHQLLDALWLLSKPIGILGSAVVN